MDTIVRNVPHATSDGRVPGTDASYFWTYDFGAYGGEVVRRYNVVFRLPADLESSFSLTDSDLAKWSGWQLTKVEAFAAYRGVSSREGMVA